MSFYTDELNRVRGPMTSPQGSQYQEPSMQTMQVQRRDIVAKGSSIYFPRDGRSEEEIKKMIEYKYDEFPVFKGNATATGGRNCGNCGAFEARPNTIPENPSIHDGYCNLYQFRDRSYGCCDGWHPNKKIRDEL